MEILSPIQKVLSRTTDVYDCCLRNLERNQTGSYRLDWKGLVKFYTNE